MPIPLGFLATAGAAAGGETFELIQSTVLGSDTSTVTLSSIPQIYKHLQLRISAKSTGYVGQGRLTFNGVSSSVYSAHRMQANGLSVTSTASVNQTFIPIADFVWLTSSSFTASIIDILDYASTSKHRTLRTFTGRPSFADGNAIIQLSSGAYREFSAITSLSFAIESAGNYAAGSRFSLYGIRG